MNSRHKIDSVKGIVISVIKIFSNLVSDSLRESDLSISLG
jgi:hypothetical protein